MARHSERMGLPGASATVFLRTMLTIIAASLLLVAGACRWTNTPSPPVADEAEPIGPPLFQDVTAESDVNFTYRNGEEADHYAILESLGGGLAVLDIDGDGLLDLFIPGGGHFDGPDKRLIKGNPCRLYRNLGSFRFEDVTAEWGLDKIAFYTHGATVADYDNDGWPDLLVTGWHHLALFHNVPVDAKDLSKGRAFVEVSEQAGLPDGLWTTSAAWGDLDGDGYPDLYVCQYVDWSFEHNHPLHCTYDGHTRDVCPPKNFVGLEHKLFRNLGNGRFQDVSKSAGLRVARTDAELEQLTWLSKRARAHLKRDVREGDTKFGKGLGVLMVDVNGDGKPDIYVANDTVDNFLYINRSTRPGEFRFEEMGMAGGTARDDQGSPNGSMGVAVSDFNGSGKPSIWVANYENELHALYRNDCTPNLTDRTKDRIVFTFYTPAAGLAVFGRQTVGWGTGFFDIDHHGSEDLFLVVGHATRVPKTSPRAQVPFLARNENGKFKNIGKQGGSYFRSPHVARGAVQADFDNDGRVDLAVIHTNEPVAILRNEADTKGHHWLGVQLVGKDHRDVVGAKIVLKAGGRKQTRFAHGGGSYASSSDRRQIFGLGTAERLEKLTVIWANGKEQTFSRLKLDRYYRLTEGSDKADPLYQKK
ncbi:MAG TPA: CRTAC1 family protein [Gemmataceae bacterium]|nr:CRTAC1 family protein [Gemmataceae bacterium]